MTSDRKAKIQSAIENIRSFHKLGTQLPKKSSPKDSYGQGVIEEEANKHGMNPDTVRKARQFADSDSGYTKDDVDELCRSIRNVQGKQDRAVFGRTHVIRLLSIPKTVRSKVQASALKKGWSIAELEAYIATRFGSRRDGGRKRRVPGDLVGVLVQLEGLCESWERWAKAVTPDDRDALQRQVSKSLELPTEVLKSVRAATKAIAELHAKVNQELQTRHPTREVRKRFRTEEESE